MGILLQNGVMFGDRAAADALRRHIFTDELAGFLGGAFIATLTVPHVMDEIGVSDCLFTEGFKPHAGKAQEKLDSLL